LKMTTTAMSIDMSLYEAPRFNVRIILYNF
jgi:hypothetical protein